MSLLHESPNRPVVTAAREAPTIPVPPVVIAVLTFRRTDGLADTITALLTECRTVENAGVLVVDNNPGRDAAPVVRLLVDDTEPFRLMYVHEPTPGIVAGRNRAIRHAADARLLVFVDDDERPTAGWLTSLLALYESRAPTAIAGPVVSEFAAPVDPWIAAGRFFVRRRMPTGRAVTVAATNNLLLDMAQMRNLHGEFDHRFGLTGGEDTLFTRQLVERGGTILWCDEAVVTDRVPQARLSRRWVLLKAFSMGNCRARVDAAMARTRPARAAARVRAGLGGIARMTIGSLRLALGAATGDLSHRALGSRMVARGAGMWAGALGYAHRHYARADAGDDDARGRAPGSDHG